MKHFLAISPDQSSKYAMRIHPNSCDAVSTSQVRQKDAYLDGLMEGRAAGRPDAWERRNWWFWIWATVLQAYCSNYWSVWETTCKRNSRIHLSNVQKSQSNKEATLDNFLATSPHTIPLCRLRHDLEDLRKTIRRTYEGFGRECGHIGSIHECHSQSSNSSRKWPWREFEKCIEFFLENYRTAVRGYLYGMQQEMENYVK